MFKPTLRTKLLQPTPSHLGQAGTITALLIHTIV